MHWEGRRWEEHDEVGRWEKEGEECEGEIRSGISRFL